ncbi:MAG: response regulator transcription factor [Coriobacteriales bacterium]|nr:response regulator transcription factor [Coriobacteriales bacterium]
MKLLFAEDDPDIRRGVTTLLQRSGYTVDAVGNGRDALSYLINGDYDAAILDIMMPGASGMDVLKEIRQRGMGIPVMMLTALGETDDRVAGFDSGADDYLPKPFAGKELVSRVRALLRRTESFTPDVCAFGDVRLDSGTYQLSCGSKSVRLGNKGFQLMQMLMRHPNKIISANEFMEHIWGWDSSAEINVVFTNISAMRKNLARIGSKVRIRVVRNAGYLLSYGDES